MDNLLTQESFRLIYTPEQQSFGIIGVLFLSSMNLFHFCVSSLDGNFALILVLSTSSTVPVRMLEHLVVPWDWDTSGLSPSSYLFRI